MDIFKAIEEGTAKYGSKKAYLQTDEYAALYAAYKRQPKVKTPKSCKIYFCERHNGFVIETGKTVATTSYLGHLGGFMGFGSSVATFSSKEDAVSFATKNNYAV